MKQSDGEILKKSIRQHFKSVEQAAVLLKKTRRQIYYYFEQDEIDCQKCQEKNIMNVAPGANPNLTNQQNRLRSKCLSQRLKR